MSNRLFQSIISQMHDVTKRLIGVMDANGAIVAASDLSKVGELRSHIYESVPSAGCIIINDYTYATLNTGNKAEYVAFCEGGDDEAKKTVSLIAISLANIKNLYDDKYDKSSFIKNVILDNILPSDVYVKSKELRFKIEGNRVVYLLRFNSKSEALPYDIVSNLFPDKNQDYVISVSEQDVVLVKEFVEDITSEGIIKIAGNIANTISSEFYTKVSIGIGTLVQNIKDLARSYKEAQVAIEVGRVFDTEKNIISYEDLGIGRLIYQLPVTLCDIFLNEVFKNGSFESLDQETLQTIQAFFENNLNVSETSRKLFVHRNTLVYRLEKIRKLTGLDLREFDNAITFKVALMVKKYLSIKENKYNN